MQTRTILCNTKWFRLVMVSIVAPQQNCIVESVGIWGYSLLWGWGCAVLYYGVSTSECQ